MVVATMVAPWYDHCSVVVYTFFISIVATGLGVLQASLGIVFITYTFL